MNVEKMRYHSLKIAIRQLAFNVGVALPHSPVNGFCENFDRILDEDEKAIAKIQLSGESSTANAFRNIPDLHQKFQPYDLFKHVQKWGENGKGAMDSEVWNYYTKAVFNRLSGKVKADLPYLDTSKTLEDQTFGIYRNRGGYGSNRPDYYLIIPININGGKHLVEVGITNAYGVIHKNIYTYLNWEADWIGPHSFLDVIRGVDLTEALERGILGSEHLNDFFWRRTREEKDRIEWAREQLEREKIYEEQKIGICFNARMHTWEAFLKYGNHVPSDNAIITERELKEGEVFAQERFFPITDRLILEDFLLRYANQIENNE